MLEQLENYLLALKPYTYNILTSEQMKNGKLYLENEERFQDVVIKF